MTIEELKRTLAARFDNAVAITGSITRTVRIGERNLVMNFAGEALLNSFYNAFQHLAVLHTNDDDPTLTLNFWDEASTGVAAPSVPWRQQDCDHLGLVSTFTTDRFYTLQQPGSDAIYFLDAVESVGYYTVASLDVLPWWESDFPLRMVFHWWLKDSTLQPVHAAAVGTEYGGLLLAGKGGSGKSTSALKCVNSALKIAGDDYVLLDCRDRIAYSLFSLTKISPASLPMLPAMKIDTNTLQTPIEGKYRVMLYPRYQDSMIHQLPIVALLLPQVTDNEMTSIVRCSHAEGMLALAPTTLFQLPGLRESSFNKMAEFIRQVPCYKLLLGNDSSKLASILENFIKHEHKTVEA